MVRKFNKPSGSNAPVEVTVINRAEPKSKRSIAADWARIIGSISQVLMLLVVAGGYYFTVLPLFQYQLSQEKAAELELNIRDKQAELAAVEPKIEKAQRDLEELKGREQQMAQQLQQSEGQYEEARQKYVNLLWHQFVRILYFKSNYDGLDSDINNWDFDKLNFKMSHPPNPYKQLYEAVSIMRSDDANSEYPAYFFDVASSTINAHRSDLACEELDLVDLNIKMQQERIRLEQQLQEGEGRMSKNEQYDVKLDLEADLYRKYRDHVYKVVNDCEDARSAVIDILREVPVEQTIAAKKQ